MSASKTSRASKKTDSLDMHLKKEVCSTPVSLSLPQKNQEKPNNEIQSSVTDNGTCSTEKSKKKKKKKKKAQSNSVDSLTEVSNNEVPDVGISADVEEKLSKLSELDVIMLPKTPVEEKVEVKVEVKVENELPSAVNDGGAESGTSKKKKKKKKKQKNSEGQDATDAPQNSVTTVFPPEPSFLKMTQSKDSPVLLVSTSEKLKKNDSSNQKLLEQNASSIVDASQQIRLVKQPPTAGFNFDQIAALRQFPILMPQANSFSSTPVSESKDSLDDGLQFQKIPPLPADQPKLETPLQAGDVNVAPEKTKAQLKAERRAIQEAQRAAKEATKKASGQVDSNQPLNKPSLQSKPVATFHNAKANIKISKETSKTSFFSHLPPFKSSALLEKHLESDDFIHPAVISVGAQYAKENIIESNACCIGILTALKKVIEDYETPPNKEISRDLGAKIKMSISFLSKCRPLSVGTLNALKFLNLQICNIPVHQSDVKGKASICEQVEKFIKDSVSLAVVAISKLISNEIVDGDVILTYAYSSLVRNALYDAHRSGKNFKVVIIDSKPTMEGKEMLRDLLKYDISCSYALISALTYAMNNVTKVIIGAYAVRASGYVMSRIGASQIALLASFRNVPFIVCCESYKFCERALIDSFVDNELGDPESFMKTGNPPLTILENWKEIPHLDLLNLLYDVTPPHLVSTLITEKSPSL